MRRRPARQGSRGSRGPERPGGSDPEADEAEKAVPGGALVWPLAWLPRGTARDGEGPGWGFLVMTWRYADA